MNKFLATFYFINSSHGDEKLFENLVNNFAMTFNTEKPFFSEFIKITDYDTYDEQKELLSQAKISTQELHISRLFPLRQAAQAFAEYHDFDFGDFCFEV